MKIDYSNAQIINSPDFYMHDDWFVNMSYEWKRNRGNSISVYLGKYGQQKNKYEIKFNNIIGFEGICCDFWGDNDTTINIYDVQFVKEEEQTLIPRLRELKEKEPNVNEFCPLLSDQKFIEIYIGFLNGDWMTIACEPLEVDDDMLKWGGDNS